MYYTCRHINTIMDGLIETHKSMLKDLVLTNQLQIVMGILFKKTFSVNGKTIYIWNTKYRQQMTQKLH